MPKLALGTPSVELGRTKRFTQYFLSMLVASRVTVSSNSHRMCCFWLARYAADGIVVFVVYACVAMAIGALIVCYCASKPKGTIKVHRGSIAAVELNSFGRHD